VVALQLPSKNGGEPENLAPGKSFSGAVIPPWATPASAVEPAPNPPRPKFAERLATVKLLLEALALLVGLVGAVLALFGLSRR
jgi:hypothetical protein